MGNATMIGRHIGFGVALLTSLSCKHGGWLRRPIVVDKSNTVEIWTGKDIYIFFELNI